MSGKTTRTLLALVFGFCATAAGADEMCPTGPSAVSIVVVASKVQVREYAVSTRRGGVARYDEESLVFHDGRVVTSNIEAAGQHLNELGWSELPIRMVGAWPRARPRRARG